MERRTTGRREFLKSAALTGTAGGMLPGVCMSSRNAGSVRSSFKTGLVIGATDKQGGYPISRPTHPNDILATMYHLLGFNPHETTIPDRLGRPMHLTPRGKVVHELLA